MIPPFGRPEDKDIQKQFMRKIRGDKLQAINAECQLQICLAFKYGNSKASKNQNKSKKPRRKQSEDDNEDIESQVQSLQIGFLPIHRREQLLTSFKTIKDKWEFKEIQDDEPLPEYFFDDGCDLSYIIYELQNSGDEGFEKFEAEDLLFLQFLCLEGRKLLNNGILKYYKENMSFMISAMNNGLQKINQKLIALNSQSNAKRKISNQEIGVSENNNNSIDVTDQKFQNNLSSKQMSELSGKKAKKQEKKTEKQSKKTKGKSKAKSEDENSEQQNESGQKNFPDGKQLALKTCNYISWAYWYVIKKQKAQQ